MKSLLAAKQIPLGSPFEEKTVSLRSGAIAAAGVLAIAALVVAFRAASHSPSDGEGATASSGAAAGATSTKVSRQPSHLSRPSRSAGVWSAMVAPFLALPWLRDAPQPAAAAATPAPTASSDAGTGSNTGPSLAWLWGGASSPAPEVPFSQPAGHPPSMLRPAGLPDLPNTITVRGPSALQRLSSARSTASGAAAGPSSGRGALVHAASALTAAAAAGVRVTTRGGGGGGGAAAHSTALLTHPSRTARYVFPFIDQQSGNAFVPVLRSQGCITAAAAAAAALKAHRGHKGGEWGVDGALEIVAALLSLACEQESLWLPLMAACGMDRGLAHAAPLAPFSADPAEAGSEEPDPGGAATAGATEAPPAKTSKPRLVVSAGVAAQLPPPYTAAAGPGDSEAKHMDRFGFFTGFGSCPVCLEPFVAGDVLVGSRDNAACRAKHSVHMACVASPSARQALSQGGCFVCRASLVHLVPLVVPTPFLGGGLAFSPWPRSDDAQAQLTGGSTWNQSLVQLARANPDGEWGFQRCADLRGLLTWGAKGGGSEADQQGGGKVHSSTAQFLQLACTDALCAVQRADGFQRGGGNGRAEGG